MRDLRLIGVHDDGEHLVVTDDTGEEFRLRIDEPLRAAARRDRPRLGQLQIAIDNNVRPAEVQAMIRAGASADEVSARTGWDLDKIARFEGPVLAEREHVASRAQAVRLRGTNQTGSPETLAQRAATRLTGRGVEASSVLWDASRDAEGQWTVSATFAAGGRERTATWWFDLAGMSVVARNDEAKWLSEADTPSGPVPTAVHRPTAVFDVEVEETKVERTTRVGTDDLVTSMREHSGAKNRRRGGRRKPRAEAGPTSTEEPLPLETAEEVPPPARGTHPRDLEEAKGATLAPSAAPAPAPAPAAAGPEPEERDEEAPAAEMKAEPEQVATPMPTADPEPEAEPEAEVVPEPEPEAVAEPAATAAAKAQPETEPKTTEPKTKTQPEATSGDDAPADDTSDAGKGARGRKGRPRVPSWDDVMFGTTRD